MGEQLATISKSFTFHAAHQVPNHDGPCRNLHGHSYVLEVAVTGRVKSSTGESNEGMVLDFGELKRIYKECIESSVEHKFINDTLSEVLPRCGAGSNYAEDEEVVATSENLAMWMHRVFEIELGMDKSTLGPIRSVQIRLWETPTSYAEVGSTWRP